MSNLNPAKRFWLLLKPDKKEVRNVYVYAIFTGLVNLSLPLGIQSIINLIQGGTYSTSWLVLVIIVLLGIAMAGFLQIAQLRITENLQQKIFTRAAFDFVYRIPRVKLEAIYKHYAPELMNRFFDIVSVQKGLSKILIDFSTAIIQGLFGLVLLSFYHPFFVAFSLTLILLVYLIFKFTSAIGLKTSLVESQHKYNVAHWLQEMARTSTTFKLAGKTELPLEGTNKSVEKYIDAREDHFKVLKRQYSLLVMFKVVVAAGLLAIGSILVMEQEMNIGQFVASEIIILLVLSSVEKLVISLETIYDVLTSLEKIGQVVDIPTETSKGIRISGDTNYKGLKVEIKNLNFSYPDAPEPVFVDADLILRSGEHLLVKGNNTTGKSTLLYLLAGLYLPQSGYIAFNDIPVGNLCLEDLRSNIGDCLMDEQLFEGTILDNIAMGRERATFDNVQWAVRNLGLETFIKQLPQGFNTRVMPQGKQFSKGIIDRLILARCIADKPRLLLIKDAFVSIQNNERNRIVDFLLDEQHDWTVIVSSTNNYLATKIDRTVVIENNKIREVAK